MIYRGENHMSNFFSRTMNEHDTLERRDIRLILTFEPNLTT